MAANNTLRLPDLPTATGHTHNCWSKVYLLYPPFILAWH